MARRGRAAYADLEATVGGKEVVSSSGDELSEGSESGSGDALETLLLDGVPLEAPLQEHVGRAAARSRSSSREPEVPRVAVRSSERELAQPETEEVPTKGKTRRQRWCFTLNQRHGEPLPPPWSVLPAGARYLAFQEEVGERGTNHYQGYIEYSKQTSLVAAKDSLLHTWIHLKYAVADAKHNSEYCSKCCRRCYDTRKSIGFVGDIVDCQSCERVAGPWEFGSPVTQGGRAAVLAAVRVEGYHEVLLSNPAGLASCRQVAKELDSAVRQKARDERGWDPPHILVYTGPSGCGKSSIFWDTAPCGQRYKVAQHNKNAVWFDGYRGQTDILIEEFHSSVPISSLLDWFDGHPPTPVPVKFGFEYPDAERWWLCTNVESYKWYTSVPKEVLQSLYRRVYRDFGWHQRYNVREGSFQAVTTQPFSVPTGRPDRYEEGLTVEQVADYNRYKKDWFDDRCPRGVHVPDEPRTRGTGSNWPSTRSFQVT